MIALASGVDNGLQELVHLVGEMFLWAFDQSLFTCRFDNASTSFGGMAAQCCTRKTGGGNRRSRPPDLHKRSSRANDDADDAISWR